MRNHGTDPRRRMRVLRERVEAMRLIWTEEEASFHGCSTSFDRIWSWPKPVQQPHPPVYVRGWGPTVLDRVLEFGQGWMPLAGRDDDEQLGQRIATLRDRAAEAGLPQPEVLPVRAVPEAAALQRYRDREVTHCLFRVPTAEPGTVLLLIEKYGALVRRYG